MAQQRMSFIGTLFRRISRLGWRIIFLILAFFFTALFVILLLQTLLFTIPVLGFATLPFSNNYNSLVQGAFNNLGFIGNSWTALQQSVNPFLLCLTKIPNATNVLTRFLLAFAALFVQAFNLIAHTNISYPAWWNARDADGNLVPFNIFDGAVAFQQELLRIERGRAAIMRAEVRSRGFDDMHAADLTARLKALEMGSRYARAEYARSFGDFIPQIVCNVISSVADIFTSVINLFAPFALDFMSLIVAAIEDGEAGDEGEFILLLVTLIGQEILKQLGFGQCITNIPNSLIQCLFPTCDQPTITDISALIFACIFQPICTTNAPKNAGDVLFQCLHIQDIINFGLSVYNGILSLQGVAQSIADFFVNLWNQIKSLQSVVNDAYNLIKRIASKFGISFRANVVEVESAYTYVDRIGTALSMQRPYSTRGSEYATLYGLYKITNGTREADVAQPLIDSMRAQFFVGNVTHHRRELPPPAVFKRVSEILARYFSDRLLAIQQLHENYVTHIHLPRDDPTVLADLRAYEALLQDELDDRVASFTAANAPPLTITNIGNYTIIPAAFLFNNTDLHLAAAALNALGGRFNVTVKPTATLPVNATIADNAFRAARAVYNATADQTPVWMAERTFGARLSRMLDVTETRYNHTNAYRQIRWLHTFFSNDTHYHKVRTIAHALDGMASVVRWGMATDKRITMPELHRRVRHIPLDRAILALHALADAVTLERNATYISPEVRDRMKVRAARWAGAEVFARMMNVTTFRTQQERIFAESAAHDDYHAQMRDIIDERNAVKRMNDVFDLQRMTIIASIVGTTVGGTAIWSGAPVAIVASLIPTLVSVVVPLLGLVTTSLPVIMAYFTNQMSNLITNMLNAGEYVVPDIFTNLMNRIGSTLAGMFSARPSPYIMEALFQQTIEWAQDAMNDVEMFVIYRIASSIPPYPFQAAVKPTKDDTPSSYFARIVFTNIDAPCITHDDCVGGFCRRLVDVNDPAGCAMMCTPELPCSPPGTCVASPLYIHENGCIQGVNMTVTFDVDCTLAGYPPVSTYLDSPEFASHGMSITFLLGTWRGYVFIGDCMSTFYVALRNIIRILAQSFMLPVQALTSGWWTNIIFVPPVVTQLRNAAALLYLVGSKVADAATSYIFPIFNWLDRHLWFINWFGIPSPFLAVVNMFRYPNYADNPPFGSPIPADYMCPVLMIGPLLIGGFAWIVVLAVVYALLFGGIFAIIFDILFFVIFPFAYLWYIAQKANTARTLNEMGFFDADVATPEQAAAVAPTWYDSGNRVESIGARINTTAPRKGAKKLPRLTPWQAMRTTIWANLTDGDFASRVMERMAVHDSAHVYHPRLGVPLRNSSPLFVVNR